MNKHIPRYRTQLVRESTATMYDVPQITSSETAVEAFAALLKATYGTDVQESMYVAFLNTKNRVIGFQQVAIGSINVSEINVSDIFRGAIVAGGPAIILAHNHPSHDPEIAPSPEDISVTKRVVEAGNLLGINVIDHIIFDSVNHYSMKEHMRHIF